MSETPDKPEFAREQVSKSTLHEWIKFLEHPCWQELVGETQEMVDALQKQLLSPLKCMDDALHQNEIIGKISGALHMSLNAGTKVALLQEEHDEAIRILKETEDAKRGRDPAGS